MDKKLDLKGYLKGYNLLSTEQTFRLTAVHTAVRSKLHSC